jgi:hypothetical protein
MSAVLLEKYETDEGVAIIAKWRKDTTNSRLIHLANLYEDENEDDPETKLQLHDMLELVHLFRESAIAYDQRRIKDVGEFLRARADYIERLMNMSTGINKAGVGNGKNAFVVINAHVMFRQIPLPERAERTIAEFASGLPRSASSSELLSM